MSEASGLGPILMGYGFLLLGVLIAAYATRRGRLRPRVEPGIPTGSLFMTGLWAGLILGGLGLLFYVSPLTGFVTVGLMLGARLLAPRARRQRNGEGS